MKKFNLFLLALALVLACCAPALGESGYLSYTNPQVGYSLKYDPAWLVVDANNYDAVYQEAEQGKTPQASAEELESLKDGIMMRGNVWIFPEQGSIQISSVKSANTLQERLKAQMEQCAAELQTMKEVAEDAWLVQDGTVEQYGNNAFGVIIYAYKMHGTEYWSGSYYAVDGSNEYVFSCSGAASKYPKAQLEQMLASFVPAQ